MRYGYKFHGPKQIKLNVTDGAAARSRICDGAFDQGAESHPRSTVESSTAHRSSPATDHRDSQGRDGKNPRDHGQNDVADSSDPDAGSAKEIRRSAKSAAGHAQCDAGIAQGDGRITFRVIREKMAAAGNGSSPFFCNAT